MTGTTGEAGGTRGRSDKKISPAGARCVDWTAAGRRETAAEVYGFDLEQLLPLAAEIGPTRQSLGS